MCFLCFYNDSVWGGGDGSLGQERSNPLTCGTAVGSVCAEQTGSMIKTITLSFTFLLYVTLFPAPRFPNVYGKEAVRKNENIAEMT